MGTYRDDVAETVDGAVAWAGESTRFWLDTYARLVDQAATGTAGADSVVRDLASLTAAGARDWARVSATWVALGNALLTLDLPEAPDGPDGGGNGNGDGNGGGTP